MNNGNYVKNGKMSSTPNYLSLKPSVHQCHTKYKWQHFDNLKKKKKPKVKSLALRVTNQDLIEV